MMAESKTKAKDEKAKTDTNEKSSEKADNGTETRQGVQPQVALHAQYVNCLLYTSPSPRDVEESRMPSSA